MIDLIERLEKSMCSPNLGCGSQTMCLCAVVDEAITALRDMEGLKEDIEGYVHANTDMLARIEELEPYYYAVDNACVVSHIGTAESFDDAHAAVNALGAWSESVGAYFAQSKIEQYEQVLDIVLEFLSRETPYVNSAICEIERIRGNDE
jgi:hypothetical protein